MDQESALKAFASGVAAELSASGEPLRFARHLGLLGEEPRGAPESPPGWVGIWEPKSEREGEVFVRSPAHTADWSYWADLPRFAAKARGKRVVLLGESVARGYFYDPQHTPAKVLEHLLGVAQVPAGSEVLDLARTNLNCEELVRLLEQVPRLSPDAIVLFAGNNWSDVRLLERWPEREIGPALLREQGVAGLKAYLDGRLQSTLAAMVEPCLKRVPQEIPLLVLVPEANLADWSFGGRVDPPWLPGSGNQRWLRCYDEAELALRQGRLEEAAALAEEMIELDAGTAAGGLQLLARCRERQGRGVEVRTLLERARDSHSWETLLQPPRAFGFVQELLREAAALPNVRVIDLPLVFQDWMNGGVPDRSLFLDYCHLTSEGIQVAMAATAEVLAPLLGGRAIGRNVLALASVAPAPAVEGEARFAAALHNAHWGQGLEIVLEHCRAALQAAPGLAEALYEFAELQTRRAPAWMCAAVDRLLERVPAGTLRRYLSTYLIQDQGKLLDEILIEAILRVLDEAGLPRRDRLDELRRREQGVCAGRPVDLLAPYCQPSWNHRDWMMRWYSMYRFYRAHAPVSRFVFSASAGQPARLQAVCRRPVAVAGELCELHLNGSRVAQLEVGTEWRRWDLELPVPLVRTGLNEVEIVWPVRTLAGGEGLRRAAEDLENDLYHDFLPVFGELGTLSVFSSSR